MRATTGLCFLAVIIFGLPTIPKRLAPSDVSAILLQVSASPGPRSGHSLVYDPLNRRLILVDGYMPPHDDLPGELWSWDGQRWERLPGSAAGPSKRIVGAAAFDVRRNRLVSFGGSHSVRGPLGDTWEWTGGAWQEMPNTAVGRRDHHAMAYDLARGRTVMFGGNWGPAPWPTVTWEWDGASWTLAAAEGPPGRSRTAMVYDDARRQIMLFGGAAPSTVPKGPLIILADTWIWNGTAWRQSPAESPAARYAHAMAFDSHRGVAIMYGGATMTADRQTTYFEDMWEWDGQRWKKIELTGVTPGKRYSPAMAFDASRRRVVLHGGLEVKGREVTAFDDVWEWDGSRWTQVR
jgi:hypothetical protein